MFVSIVDQETFKVYGSREDAPPGSVVLASPEELAAALPNSSSLDKIRGRLLGVEVEPSGAVDLAARRLWHVFTMGCRQTYVEMAPVKDQLGNMKFKPYPIELLQLVYTKGRDSMVDFFYKKLPPQAKKLVQIITEDGRQVWTGEEFQNVVLARGDEFGGKQKPVVVMNYYRPELIAKKILRRVSFEEFAASPEFSGLILEDKAAAE